MNKNIKFYVSLGINVVLVAALLAVSVRYDLFKKLANKVFAAPHTTVTVAATPTPEPTAAAQTAQPASASTTPELTPSTPGEVVAFLGDSITYEVQWNKYFPEYKTINESIPGRKVLDVFNALQSAIDQKPAKVFVLVGINDIGNDVPLEQSMASYDKIIWELKDKLRSSEIYVQSVLPCNLNMRTDDSTKRTQEHIRAFNVALQRLAEKYGVPFLDLYGSFSDDYGAIQPVYSRDGIHLSEDGHAYWADLIRQYVYK